MKLTIRPLLVVAFTCFVRFYRDVMGFEVTWGDEDSGYADFKTGETTLALFDRAAMAGASAHRKPANTETQDRSMLIFEADDLDSLIPKLQARGANVIKAPQDYPDWGIRAAYIRDPDGNLIEINKPVPREQWSEELLAEAEAQD